MKYATGRKGVMYSSMKQTCLPHSKNMIHTCSTCIRKQTHTDFFSHVTSHYYKKDQYRRLAESVHTGLIEKKGEKRYE